MLHAVVFDTEIKLWWEYVKERKSGCVFRITDDNRQTHYTQKTHYAFKNLQPNATYRFSVDLLDAKQKKIVSVGEICVHTLPQKKKIDVTKSPYNAVGDGETLNTQALQRAFNDCGKDEYVYLPDGVYRTGALDMHGDSELCLSDGAVMQGTANAEDYLPKVWSRFEGIERLCYRSLINIGQLDHTAGCTCANVVIRGGTIRGGGNALRKNIIERERRNEADYSAFTRTVEPGRTRGRLIRASNAKNVIIANTKAGDSPSWNLHFIYCENVITCGSTIFSHGISNGDGWDPDSSENCVVFDCDFDTGDDCVAIKSGKNPEGNVINRATKNVRVFDVRRIDGHGIAIGSEMSGGIEDVKIWDCDVEDSFGGINVKYSKKRGGYIKNVGIYNVRTSQIKICSYGGNDDGEGAEIPCVENFELENITVKGVETYTSDNRSEKTSAITIRGFEEAGHTVKNVLLKDVTLLYRPMMPWQIFDITNSENVTVENIVCRGEID